jgi:hypothetical protein
MRTNRRHNHRSKVNDEVRDFGRWAFLDYIFGFSFGFN